MHLIKILIKAARIRTLPLSISGIVSSNAIMYYIDAFRFDIFFFTLFTAILLQIISNLSNDIGDFEKGTDNENRIGEKRILQSNLLSVDTLKKINLIISVITLVVGFILIFISNTFFYQKIIFLFIGLFALWSSQNYTQGKNAYGYKGFGDIAVFIFFGIIAVLGSQFLIIHSINNSSILVAIAMGLLSTAVLTLNNLRDIENDKNCNKKTLVVLMGYENSKLYFLLLVYFGVFCWIAFVYTLNNIFFSNYIYFIPLITLLYFPTKVFKTLDFNSYDKMIKPFSLIIFFTSILFFISFMISI